MCDVDEVAAHTPSLRPMSPRKRDEPVRLTTIYTRGGDRGETSLGDGSRVSKLDLRVVAYGAVDELNSHLGLVLALEDVDAELREPLVRIQNDLFDLGADLSVPQVPGSERLRVTQAQVDELERLCDVHNERLPELKSFVLPGGSELAARLHVARAVCRRAELAALAAATATEIDPLVPVYLNRLSDLLFILARAANADGEEPLWRPGGASESA
jgi:cob(I)alamin adenosyltransferase